MRIGATDLTSLFVAGLSHLQCRELCEAASGFKLSRINVEPALITPLRDWCREHDLACEVSDFGVLENLHDEGKGMWWNTGRRVAGEASIVYAYVGQDPKEVSQLKSLEAGNEHNKHERIAELLAIPECCTMFYVRHREDARASFHDDYVTLTFASTESCPPYEWRANYLAQYFGLSLIHHFPCRWDCPATIERALRSEAVVGRVSKAWLALHRRWLRSVVVVEGSGAVHLIRGTTHGSGVRFRPDQIRSTADTPLVDCLRRIGELKWTERCAPVATIGEFHTDLLILPFTANAV